MSVPPFKVVIPARFAATRLPGKPLQPLLGRPLMQHVYERALESEAEEVWIATDNDQVFAAAREFTEQVLMTSAQHRSGTERLAEVAAQRQWPADSLVVNLQGDEPLMPGELIRRCAELLCDDAAVMATLACPIRRADELWDPHVVKLVLDAQDHALYFSRATIPWHRDEFSRERGLPEQAVYWRHIGLYAYRVGFLQHYQQLAACELEQIESLEQLRVLFHGERIKVGRVDHLPEAGVDTPEDLARVEALMKAHGLGRPSAS